MDERTIKRLLFTLAVAIAIIMLAKFMLTNTFTRLNHASANKKLSADRQSISPPVVLSQTAFAPESAPASAVMDAGFPASVVGNVAQ